MAARFAKKPVLPSTTVPSGIISLPSGIRIRMMPPCNGASRRPSSQQPALLRDMGSGNWRAGWSRGGRCPRPRARQGDLLRRSGCAAALTHPPRGGRRQRRDPRTSPRAGSGAFLRLTYLIASGGSNTGFHPLIPAKAETQVVRRAGWRAGRQRHLGQPARSMIWVPAFAGMSGRGVQGAPFSVS